MQLQTSESDEVLAAIVYLADRCNGATSEDGAGFNKFDADNGHRMAEIIRSGGRRYRGDSMLLVLMGHCPTSKP